METPCAELENEQIRKHTPNNSGATKGATFGHLGAGREMGDAMLRQLLIGLQGYASCALPDPPSPQRPARHQISYVTGWKRPPPRSRIRQFRLRQRRTALFRSSYQMVLLFLCTTEHA
jgi:hypothetical protein